MSTPGNAPAPGHQQRPVPDTGDLRILAELINNPWIPLHQAAFNARMSQHEAADRLVTMAERGMPLRLVAEGDRAELWRIAQAGPATGSVGGVGRPPTDHATGAPSGTQPAVPGAFVPGAATGGPASPGPGFPPAAPAGPGTASTPAADLAAPHGGLPAAGPSGGHPGSGALPVGPAGPPPSGATPGAAFPGAETPSVPQGHPVAPPGAPTSAGQPGTWTAPPSGAAAVGSPAAYGPPPGAPSSTGAPAGPFGPPSAPDQFSAPVPPIGPVPPHEQAIAGAVPLGEFPFGLQSAGPGSTPSAPADDAESAPLTPPPAGGQVEAPVSRGQHAAPDHDDHPAPAAPPAAAQLWGIPGSSDWARVDPGADSAGPSDPAPADQPAPEPSAAVDPVLPASGADPEDPVDPEVPADGSAAPTGGPATPVELPPLRTVGLFGEHLVVQVTALLDPADDLVTATGLQLDPGERAILVRTAVQNTSPIDHTGLPDQFLTLLTDDGRMLSRAALSVPGHPVHRVGIPAGTRAEGWSLFLVPDSVTVRSVRWDVRPEPGPQTLHWQL